jgi:hypothetical protein
MMFDYAEKRDFLRMPIESPARFRQNGNDHVSSTMVKNLSANGMLLIHTEAIEPDTNLRVEIIPARNITPPLSAEVSVLRSKQSEEGNYEIACRIVRILPENETGPEFP